MARRMFTPEIVESDAFFGLPVESQALYLHLCMSADDDGFVNTAFRIVSAMRDAGAQIDSDALKTLVEEKFVLQISRSVYCIKHWRMHNNIRQDRKKPTAYQEELASLQIKENGSYSQNVHRTRTTCGQNAGNSPSICGQFADKMPHRLGKDRLGKDSIVESAPACARTREDTATSIYGKFNNVNLTDVEYAKLKQMFPDHYDDRIERLSAYMNEHCRSYPNHFEKIVEWAKKDNVPTEAAKPKSYDLDEFFEAAVKKGATP